MPHGQNDSTTQELARSLNFFPAYYSSHMYFSLVVVLPCCFSSFSLCQQSAVFLLFFFFVAIIKDISFEALKIIVVEQGWQSTGLVFIQAYCNLDIYNTG